MPSFEGDLSWNELVHKVKALCKKLGMVKVTRNYLLLVGHQMAVSTQNQAIWHWSLG